MPIKDGTLHGVVHGKTIELDEDAGLPDGQRVAVAVQPIPSMPECEQGPLDALKAAAGAWADDLEGLEGFLEWIRQRRKAGGRGLSG